MKKKFLLYPCVAVLLFLFSCSKEEVLENKTEVRVLKGRIADEISVNDAIDTGKFSHELQEIAKFKNLDPEIGQYTLAIDAKQDPGIIRDQTSRVSVSPFPGVPTTPEPFLPESSYLPFIKPGNNYAWFSNTGSISRNNIILGKSTLFIGPWIYEAPRMLIYCSFVAGGNSYQFRNYPLVSMAGTSNLAGVYTQYTVEAYKTGNLPVASPEYAHTPAHYDGSGNYISGGYSCVANCGSVPGTSNTAAWQVGTVNITSVGYVNGQDKFTIAGTLTVQGTTVAFNLASYYRYH